MCAVWGDTRKRYQFTTTFSVVLLKYLSWGFLFFFYLFVFVCRKRSWWSRSEVLMPHSEETENATNLSHREERGWSKHRSAWLPKFSAVQHRWSRLTLLIQLCILLGVNQHNLQFYLQFDKESTLENKMLKTQICLSYRKLWWWETDGHNLWIQSRRKC